MTHAPRLRRVAALVLVLMIAGCSAQVVVPRASDGPSSSTDVTRPLDALADTLYLRSSDAYGGTILVIDAGTGQTVRSMRDGAISPGGTLYWAESSSGGTKTKVHLTDLVSGKDLRSFTIEGDLRPAGRTGTLSASAGDGWVTQDGLRLALMSSPYKISGEWLTKLAVVNTQTGAMESSAEFRGQNTYGILTFAPDGRSLFLEEYGEGGVGTRVYDLASGRLGEASGPGLKATGFRTAAVLSPDGRWLFRLDAGSPTTNCTSTDGPACQPNAIAPHVVALDLSTRRATTIALPADQLSAQFEKAMVWSLAITPDGTTLYAVNSALGVINLIDARHMTLRRTAQISVARSPTDVLNTIARFLLPTAEAKRYLIGGALLSPDGGTLYAAGHVGISAIDTSPLGTNAVWQQTYMFDTLSLSPDGRRLYAVSNMSRTLLIIDTTTGEKLGEVKGLGYVSAIVRVESR